MRWRDLLALNAEHPVPAHFFATPRRVRFVGIGGVGMSSLARLLRHRGHEVCGSDAADSPALEGLRRAGIACQVGHSAANVGSEDALFYSSAVADDNPELVEAKKRGIPVWHRSQLMAHVANAARVSIAVSGTHGKSTTSAMIAHILTQCGHNPTALLGAVYPPFGSNLRLGNPDLVVLEADESDGSFTLVQPTVAVVLNVEPEHLENYDHAETELWRAFALFVGGVTGRVVLNADDPMSAARLAPVAACEVCRYGTREASLAAGAQFVASTVSAGAGEMRFELNHGRSAVGNFGLFVPGEHNVSNAMAAIAATQTPDEKGRPLAEPEAAAVALASFAGTLRRFERKGESHGVLVYDDYGHHPTEVRATLDAASAFLKRPLFVIFQPHRYSRTQQLGELFGSSLAFRAAEAVIITELYSAFEDPIPGVSGRLVYDAVRTSLPGLPVFYAPDLEQAQLLALEYLRSGDAVITMGAGDITGLGSRLLADWEALHRGR